MHPGEYVGRDEAGERRLCLKAGAEHQSSAGDALEWSRERSWTNRPSWSSRRAAVGARKFWPRRHTEVATQATMPLPGDPRAVSSQGPTRIAVTRVMGRRHVAGARSA